MSRAAMGFALGFVVFAAASGCAKPAPSSLPDSGGFVEHGPTADFAGFISNTPDMAQPVVADLAKPADASLDASMAPSPVDMATTAQTGACGAVTYAGLCNANVLKYCLSSVLTTIDCGAKSLACKVDASGDANCHYAAGSACGALGSGGVCDGNTVAYCSNSKIVLLNCSSTGSTCGEIFGFASCF